MEFYRLCDESGWGKDHPDKKTAHKAFKDAIVKQFNVVYGTDVNDLGNWQNLCHVVRINPVPEGLEACREASNINPSFTTCYLTIPGRLL